MDLPTVLLVEGSAPVRDRLSLALRRAGWRVRWTASVEEALARLRRLAPDAVLLGGDLPGLHGNAGLAELRRHGFDGPALALPDAGRHRESTLRLALDALRADLGGTVTP